MNYGYLNWSVYSPQDRKKKTIGFKIHIGV